MESEDVILVDGELDHSEVAHAIDTNNTTVEEAKSIAGFSHLSESLQVDNLEESEEDNDQEDDIRLVEEK